METQTTKDLADISNLVNAVLKQKSSEGKDYYFMQKTGRETYYLDDNNNVLIHNIKKEDGNIYLLELEEDKKRDESCSFSIYLCNGSMSLKKILGVSDSEESNENKAQAADLFRRFRDASSLDAELKKYSKKNCEVQK